MRRCLIHRSFGRWVVAALMAVCFCVPAPLVAQKTVGKKAGEERSDNKLKMKLCWCPPGKFKMGSPKNEKGRFKNENQVKTRRGGVVNPGHG